MKPIMAEVANDNWVNVAQIQHVYGNEDATLVIIALVGGVNLSIRRTTVAKVISRIQLAILGSEPTR